MATFTYDIVQTNRYTVSIEATDSDAAKDIFDDYLTEDFGEPNNSHLEYTVTEQ